MPVEYWVPTCLEEAQKQFVLDDDFFYYVTADKWTTTASNSGTVATSATTVGGSITISPSDGSVTDNDETYIESTVRAFKFADDKPCGCYVEGTFTEPAAADANWILGFIESIGADTILDDGAGPPADYDGAVFVKVDGGTNWVVETSIGTTQTTTTTNITASSTSKQRFMIKCRPVTSTKYEVTFWHAIGTTAPLMQCKDNTNGLPIVHTLTLFSNAVMNFGVGAKNGADSNHAVVLLDYVCAWQTR